MHSYKNYKKLSVYKTCTLAILLLFLFSVAVAHESEKPATTPDKPLYGLSVALDKLSLALTFDNYEKARKGLTIAHERLLEIRAMRESGKLDKAEAAAKNYASAQNVVANSVGKFRSPNAEKEASDIIDIEEKLAEVEEEASEVSGELVADVQIAETDGKINERINKINEKISAHKKTIEKLEARKAQLREKVPEEKLKEIERKHDRLVEREIKASDAIAKAEQEIIKAELVADKIPRGEEAIKNANEHLERARGSFAAKKYGEAFGQATAAYHIAKAVINKAEQIIERDKVKQK